MTNEEIIRDEAQKFAKWKHKLRRVPEPVEIFNEIKYRLTDFNTSQNKSIFLDEIKIQIVQELESHRKTAHEGNADPSCGWEIKVEKILFYIDQHLNTLPIVVHQKFTSSKKDRLKVFVSYSHKDSEYLTEIRKHFKPFLDKIEFWDDSRIEPGQKWKDEIKKALHSAKVGILLVSSDFLASDFISTDELPPLLNAAEKDGATILSVILRPCLFEEFHELNQYQALNPPSKPLVKMTESEREDIYVNLVRQTLKLLKNE